MTRRLRIAEDEIPLLTRFQQQLLDTIQEKLECKIRELAPFNNAENDRLDIAIIISGLEEQLKIIKKHLKFGRSAKLRYKETYPKWRENRDICIPQLKEIAESLNSDRWNCNISKLVGYCASFVGGGITIASAILIPFTLGLTTPLAIAGGSLTAAGCSTAIGTSVTEILLLRNKVAKAKMLIEVDKRYFLEMKDWLNNASELQESLAAVSETLSDILGSDILSKLKSTLKDFVERVVKIKNESQRTIFIEQRLSYIIEKFKTYLERKQLPIITLTSIVMVLVTVLLLLQNHENRLVFDCASLTIRSFLGIATLIDESLDVFRLSGLFAGKAVFARDFARAVTRGAVAAVGIVLDVIGIIFTSVDIHKGSLSPEAQKINEAVESLTEETAALERVYNSLHPN